MLNSALKWLCYVVLFVASLSELFIVFIVFIINAMWVSKGKDQVH